MVATSEREERRLFELSELWRGCVNIPLSEFIGLLHAAGWHGEGFDRDYKMITRVHAVLCNQLQRPSGVIPEVGSQWSNPNGHLYRVTGIANIDPSPEKAARYPTTIVYQNENGDLHTRNASLWPGKMKPYTPSNPPEVDYRQLVIEYAESVVRFAEDFGYEVSIEQVSTHPPAMGRKANKVSVSPKRKDGRYE
jgi:hypothetical protein